MFDEVASQKIPGIARLPLTLFQLKADEMIEFASLCTAKFIYTRSFWTSLQNDLKCWVSEIYIYRIFSGGDKSAKGFKPSIHIDIDANI